MAIKHIFAVQFKHAWDPHPVWETFWTENAAQAAARASLLYQGVDQTIQPEIIKVVPLAAGQAIMPPEVRRHNRRVERRNQRKENHE